MATKTGLLEAFFSALGDTMWEMGSGSLLTRSTANVATGSTSITVEGTDMFPASGVIAIKGVLYAYSAKTATSFNGLQERTGPGLSVAGGLVEGALAGTVIMDFSKTETQLDKLRASQMLRLAEEEELDVIGRNYGVPRPRGLTDATYRSLLQVMIATEAQTIYSMEKALDVLHGAGNYDLYERAQIDSELLKVFVGVPGTTGSESRGRAFLSGGEAAARTSLTTVDVDEDITQVYGVYDDTDYQRVGQNYAMKIYGASAGFTTAAKPTALQDTTNSPFTSADVDKPVLMTMPSGDKHHWRVGGFVSTTEVELRWPQQNDGLIVSGGISTFLTEAPWFPEWVATGGTEACEIVIPTGANAGSYEVTGWTKPGVITVSGTFPAAETEVGWYLRPKYGANTITTYDIFRATAASKTVTTPENMPTDVLVDYTNVESAEIKGDAAENADAQRAFYFFDYGAITRSVLDLLTAAGVTVETEII